VRAPSASTHAPFARLGELQPAGDYLVAVMRRLLEVDDGA
jgi:hypothetical protein